MWGGNFVSGHRKTGKDLQQKIGAEAEKIRVKSLNCDLELCAAETFRGPR